MLPKEAAADLPVGETFGIELQKLKTLAKEAKKTPDDDKKLRDLLFEKYDYSGDEGLADLRSLTDERITAFKEALNSQEAQADLWIPWLEFPFVIFSKLIGAHIRAGKGAQAIKTLFDRVDSKHFAEILLTRRDTDGSTVLYDAVLAKDVDTIRTLKELLGDRFNDLKAIKGDKSALTGREPTALDYARKGDTEIIELLTSDS